MAVPGYVYRESLIYTKIPELRQIDIDICNIGRTKPKIESYDIYYQALSNAGSFSNLITNNFQIVSSYIIFLEDCIADNNNLTNDKINLVEQKIKLLESVYSNLSQVSTQSA